MINAKVIVVENSKKEPEMFIYTNPNSIIKNPVFYKAVKMSEEDLLNSNLKYVDPLPFNNIIQKNEQETKKD